jgi:hypothetical protein
VCRKYEINKILKTRLAAVTAGGFVFLRGRVTPLDSLLPTPIEKNGKKNKNKYSSSP